MKYTSKYKLFTPLLLMMLLVLNVAGTLRTSAAALLSAGSNFAAYSTVTCDTNETPMPTKDGSTHACCPSGTKLVPVQGNEEQVSKAMSANSKACLYSKYVNPLINLLSALVGLAVVIGIIVGAIQFSSSAGDPQQAAKGKNHIRNALIALLVYLFFYALLQFLVPGGLL